MTQAAGDRKGSAGGAATKVVALRGTKPSERPAIIRALDDAKARTLPRRRKGV
ncbi:hypothetical protein [Lentzea albida]|uniref:hypothetical protein n=1 Tax=Lentzea albida TaxID=65499 RepID=UPI0015A5FFA1|nr:hypothetical protein [Lentzea albida]